MRGKNYNDNPAQTSQTYTHIHMQRDCDNLISGLSTQTYIHTHTHTHTCAADAHNDNWRSDHSVVWMVGLNIPMTPLTYTLSRAVPASTVALFQIRPLFPIVSRFLQVLIGLQQMGLHFAMLLRPSCAKWHPVQLTC